MKTWNAELSWLVLVREIQETCVPLVFLQSHSVSRSFHMQPYSMAAKNFVQTLVMADRGLNQLPNEYFVFTVERKVSHLIKPL